MSVCGCTTICFDDKIVSFCEGSNFRKYVRSAINDELFWRDIVAKMNLSTTIDDRLSSKLPSETRTQIEKMLPDMLKVRFIEYITEKFPAQVTREIKAQLPEYLNNSYQMQEILNKHKIALTEQLDATVRKIMEKIVNDPAHQEVCNAHLAAIDYKGELKINEISQKAESQMRDNKSRFDQELSQMKVSVSQEMFELKNSLSEVKLLNQRIETMNRKHEKEITNLKWLAGCAIGLAATFLGIFAIMKAN